jgi:hypothetical protein
MTIVPTLKTMNDYKVHAGKVAWFKALHEATIEE